jgi:molecular chaperone HscB
MNYFEVFGLPVSFKIDENVLLQSYLRRQSAVHPDVTGGESGESRLLNTAYRTLTDPTERAKHFLEVRGRNTDMTASEFAEEMFALRESCESLTSQTDREELVNKLSERLSDLVRILYDLENDIDEFAKHYGLLRFVRSFLDRINGYCGD